MITVRIQHGERRTSCTLQVTAKGSAPVSLAPTQAAEFALEPGESLKVTCRQPDTVAAGEPDPDEGGGAPGAGA